MPSPDLSFDRTPRGIDRWMPGVALMRDYRREWFARDLVAGLVLTAMLVPVGMGYARASGLPPIHGLYATIVPLVAYALFGPSRIMVLGPDSSLCALIAATILPLSAGDPERALTLAAALAVLSGVICLAAGVAKAGFFADLFSKPIRYGFLNGIALTVLVGQLPSLCGFRVEGDGVGRQALGFVRGLWAGESYGPAVAIGVGSLAVILSFRRWAPRVPGVLIAVVAATMAVAVFDPSGTSGLSVVGAMPRGLPRFAAPHISLAEWGSLLTAAVAIALVSFADTSVLSRSLGMRTGRDVDASQELVALGAANLATGLFQGFPISSSSSRTPVAEAAGAQTQVSCLVGAASLAFLLMAAPTLLQHLPIAALAAVVIAACLSLFEIRGVVRLFDLRRGEFAVSVVCSLGVLILGSLEGIFIAIGFALLAFVWRAWRPYDAVLGRVDRLKGYHDVSRHPEARRIPGLVLFRWDAPLFFANAEIFRRHVRRAIATAPTPTKSVVVAAEPVTDVDTTSADMLVALDQELHERGIELCFAEMKGPVKDHLHRYGLSTRFGDTHFFRTLEEAVDRFVELHNVEWHDWDK